MVTFFLGERLAVSLVLELPQDVDIRSADAGMDARPVGFRQGLAAGLDIAGHRAGQGADGGTRDFPADEPHGFESSGEDAG